MADDRLFLGMTPAEREHYAAWCRAYAEKLESAGNQRMADYMRRCAELALNE
jgi:hypothetical protein